MKKNLKKNGYHRIMNQKTERIKLVKHYKNGLVHGKIVYYWDNGQIRLTGQYEKMRRSGSWKHYDHDGTLILEENYDRKEKHQTDQLVLLPL
jgi:antitoxin component YwqK of YwqJK toxin-antitoxin module